MIRGLCQQEMLKISYITKEEGAVHIRSVNAEAETIWQTCKTLNARYVVAAFDWDAAAACPVWSVYDVRKMSTRVPGSQDRSLPLPLRQFTTEKRDAAEMYALTLMAQGN